MDGWIQSIVGSAIVLIAARLIVWARDKYSLNIARSDPRKPTYILNTILILGWVLNITFIFITFLIDLKFWWLIPIFSVWCLMVTIYIWRQRTRMHNLGIVGIDQEIRKGIDYNKSLSLCRNTLHFLGIGARKLTIEKEFENAISRCKDTEPIKFLLCKPDHKQLQDAAARFGADREEYKKRVIDSIRTIARLKEKCPNIEVRFYEEFQWFRLMFIDDSICLFSYNLMGQGDGSQLPQLHLATRQGEREVDSFYHVFARYFDNLWDKSEEWDFRKYLEG
jgi:hypothetical protein